VLLSGVRDALDPHRRERVASQHVVGALTLTWAAEVAEGGPLDRASNRVRDVLDRGSLALRDGDDALFRGLVLGDDAEQTPAMVDRFRASGLSHLTAVSGQNVAFVLAAAGPFLRRLRPAARWAVTVALIAWFVMLTRFEPSIIRAGAMAALSATAFVLGRERHPARLLWIAVIGLLLIDPLLARSVGFWLSTGATAGVTMIGPWLVERLRPLGLLAAPVAITLAAQAGVLVPAVLVFGHVPLVSVPANVLAGPVAGGVMLYGLPAGLLAGAVPVTAPVVMLPCRLGVRWVDLVAMLGARLEPGGAASVVGWLFVLAAVGVLVMCGSRRNRR
jgi:competence protein ComEC